MYRAGFITGKFVRLVISFMDPFIAGFADAALGFPEALDHLPIQDPQSFVDIAA